MAKALAVLFFSWQLFFSYLPASAGYLKTADYLCDVGRSFISQGRYEEALEEFKRALIADPDCKSAKRYIESLNIILNKENTKKHEALRKEATVSSAAPLPAKKASSKPVASPSKSVIVEPQAAAVIYPEVKPNPGMKISSEKHFSFNTIKLSEYNAIEGKPLEIEQGSLFFVEVDNLKRFLVTEPMVLEAVRKENNIIQVLAKEIGYAYLHIWDDAGRKTLEFLVLAPKPKYESLEEKMRQQEEGLDNFKLSYSLDWSSFETGRRFDSLNRSEYSYMHNLGMWGVTPYGDVDAALTVNRFDNNTAEASHYTLGLTNGQFGPFKGFSLRAFDIFDFPPNFSNMSYSGTPLRGGYVYSPAFNNRLNYTVFYGRENNIPYGNISPELTQAKDVYVQGVNVGLAPTPMQYYNINLVRGWGKDRDIDLNPYGYDLSGEWKLNKWQIRQETAFDSETFANLSSFRYADIKTTFNAELRDVSKKFKSITSDGWMQGERGSSFTATFRPDDKTDIYSFLDIYQDRLYPDSGNPDRLNEDFNLSLNYRFNRTTSGRVNYLLQNELGRISAYRYQNADLGFSHNFKPRDLSLSWAYFHQEYTNYSNPASDYINERLFAGLRFNLIGNIYYYANKEFNFLNDVYNSQYTYPNAFETGLDYRYHIFRTPFSGSFRLTYRDEEDTQSDLSFLTGEDYLEGYTELIYRPQIDTEIYSSMRMRNVWAENPRAQKRYEVNFNAGLRYLWDTGLSWQASGTVEGYVFKDLNSDGIMDRAEAPVEGIKVWLGKNRQAVTDLFGYFCFKSAKGKKTAVSIDTGTIPQGFVLTVPASQQVSIAHNKTSRIDFGIASRSEISGYVFEDIDHDGQLSKTDLGIRGVVLILNGNQKRTTDLSGRYVFSSVAPGEYSLELDLEKLPVYYLPKVPLIKKIKLFEGAAYYYNIPVERNAE
jgi:hypothetical protein